MCKFFAVKKYFLPSDFLGDHFFFWVCMRTKIIETFKKNPGVFVPGEREIFNNFPRNLIFFKLSWLWFYLLFCYELYGTATVMVKKVLESINGLTACKKYTTSRKKVNKKYWILSLYFFDFYVLNAFVELFCIII